MTMQLCLHGCLFDLVKDMEGISDEVLLKYMFLQICRGLQTVHEKARYAHLDLKLENILIGNDFNLKLCDFGSSRTIDEKITK